MLVSCCKQETSLCKLLLVPEKAKLCDCFAAPIDAFFAGDEIFSVELVQYVRIQPSIFLNHHPHEWVAVVTFTITHGSFAF